MKSFSVSILLAACLLFAITSALVLDLESRQATVKGCAKSADCLIASSWWSDCQRANNIGHPFYRISNVRSCLCSQGHEDPSRMDWYPHLRDCIICVETIIGSQSADILSLQMDQLVGSPESTVGFCHHTMSTQEFVRKTKALVKANDFPLDLPEASLRRHSEHVFRAVTTKNLLASIQPNIDFAVSSALADFGFTQTEQTSTLTALFDNQFSTFSAVPMESLVSSIPSAIPTAIFNSKFSTFSAVPMSSFLASIATAIPTAIPNSQFSTFSAVPMESFSSGIRRPIPTPPLSFSDSSEDPIEELVIEPSDTVIKTCNHDNCLRQAIRSKAAVATFCAAYTKSPKPARRGLTDPLSACENSSARLLSACSCLASHTSSITAALPTATQMSTIMPPDPDATHQAFASSNMSASTSLTRISHPILTSLPTLPLPQLHWASLPASPEVLACSRSAGCTRAGQIFRTCAAEEQKQGGNVKFCFCNTNHNDWTSSLSACAFCIAKNLPATPPSTAPAGRDTMVKVVEMTASIYCEPASQGSVKRLTKAGKVITAYLQSPVLFFNMSNVTQAFPIPK